MSLSGNDPRQGDGSFVLRDRIFCPPAYHPRDPVPVVREVMRLSLAYPDLPVVTNDEMFLGTELSPEYSNGLQWGHCVGPAWAKARQDRMHLIAWLC